MGSKNWIKILKTLIEFVLRFKGFEAKVLKNDCFPDFKLTHTLCVAFAGVFKPARNLQIKL